MKILICSFVCLFARVFVCHGSFVSSFVFLRLLVSSCVRLIFCNSSIGSFAHLLTYSFRFISAQPISGFALVLLGNFYASLHLRSDDLFYCHLVWGELLLDPFLRHELTNESFTQVTL